MRDGEECESDVVMTATVSGGVSGVAVDVSGSVSAFDLFASRGAVVMVLVLGSSECSSGWCVYRAVMSMWVGWAATCEVGEASPCEHGSLGTALPNSLRYVWFGDVTESDSVLEADVREADKSAVDCFGDVYVSDGTSDFVIVEMSAGSVGGV